VEPGQRLIKDDPGVGSENPATTPWLTGTRRRPRLWRGKPAVAHSYGVGDRCHEAGACPALTSAMPKGRYPIAKLGKLSSSEPFLRVH